MKRGFAIAALMGCALIWPATEPSWGQNNPIKEATGFYSVDYFGPPNQLQMSSRFSGAEAKQVSDNLMLVKQMKLETFETNGAPKYVIEAPECLYDREKQIANSPGPIKIRPADNHWVHTGRGFLWIDGADGGFLKISNAVDTVFSDSPGTKLTP